MISVRDRTRLGRRQAATRRNVDSLERKVRRERSSELGDAISTVISCGDAWCTGDVDFSADFVRSDEVSGDVDFRLSLDLRDGSSISFI